MTYVQKSAIWIVVILALRGAVFAYEQYTAHTPLALAKWQTFESKDYGIQLKYPQNIFRETDDSIRQADAIDAKGSANQYGTEAPDYRENTTIFSAQNRKVKPPYRSIDGGLRIDRPENGFTVSVINIPYSHYQPASKAVQGTLIPWETAKSNCKLVLEHNAYTAYMPAADRTVVMEFQTCGLKKEVLEKIVSSIMIVPNQSNFTQTKEDKNTIYYSGQMTVSGKFDESNDGLIPNLLCFTADSTIQLPITSKDKGRFCFDNQAEVKKLLGINDKTSFNAKCTSVSGKATIILTGYNVSKHTLSEDVDMAVLLKVFSADKPACE